MKEKVYINIKGLQLAAQNVPRDYEEDEDDPVEVINVGRYRIINGKEYIKYDRPIRVFYYGYRVYRRRMLPHHLLRSNNSIRCLPYVLG